jgi:hypothetical protein
VRETVITIAVIEVCVVRVTRLGKVVRVEKAAREVRVIKVLREVRVMVAMCSVIVHDFALNAVTETSAS